MDKILGVLIAAVGFAVFIFMVDRSVKYLTLVGVSIIAIAALVILWGVR
ncbi:MAG: hypothetical protein JSV94_01410 [Methanobacteriota archaeon]|nr:MAG: hypothetical protein JSV94_01410 [Euryarchaeota archaeon]